MARRPPDRYYTAAMVSDRLHVTKATVMRLNRHGRLHGEFLDGQWVFPIDDVEAFARIYTKRRVKRLERDDARLTVRAFKLFDSGCRDIREAVTKLCVTPTQIVRLYALWRERDLDKQLDARAANLKVRRAKNRRAALRTKVNAAQTAKTAGAKPQTPAIETPQDTIQREYEELWGKKVPVYGPKRSG